MKSKSNIRKIIRVILREFVFKESYDDVSIDFTKNKQKMWDYDDFVDKKEIGDFTYLNFVRNDSWYLCGNILVFENSDGTEVANAFYGKKNKDDPMKSTIDVRPDKRRLGIASNIYQWIEELTGNILYPDMPHSKKAEKVLGTTKQKIWK